VLRAFSRPRRFAKRKRAQTLPFPLFFPSTKSGSLKGSDWMPELQTHPVSLPSHPTPNTRKLLLIYPSSRDQRQVSAARPWIGVVPFLRNFHNIESISGNLFHGYRPFFAHFSPSTTLFLAPQGLCSPSPGDPPPC